MRRIALGICLLVCIVGCCTGCNRKTASGTSPVRINEVQTAGGTDWVELYNTASHSVSLKGCFLSDDPDSPGKWMFPNITLDAGGYLLLHADKGESTASHLSLPFHLNAAGETLVFSDKHGTLLDTVTVPESPAGVSYGLNAAEKFVWYASPTPESDNKSGMELGSQSVNTDYGLRITEYMSRNSSFLHDKDGDYGDWIEIHNFSQKDISLDRYYLTDSKSEVTKWQFPQGTVLPANQYLVVFCSKKDKSNNGEYHTNFRLGNNDAFLGLYTSDGNFCSGVSYHPTEQNQSVAYMQNGDYEPCRYPTPGYANPQ